MADLLQEATKTSRRQDHSPSEAPSSPRPPPAPQHLHAPFRLRCAMKSEKRGNKPAASRAALTSGYPLGSLLLRFQAPGCTALAAALRAPRLRPRLRQAQLARAKRGSLPAPGGRRAPEGRWRRSPAAPRARESGQPPGRGQEPRKGAHELEVAAEWARGPASVQDPGLGGPGGREVPLSSCLLHWPPKPLSAPPPPPSHPEETARW